MADDRSCKERLVAGKPWHASRSCARPSRWGSELDVRSGGRGFVPRFLSLHYAAFLFLCYKGTLLPAASLRDNVSRKPVVLQTSATAGP